MRSDRGDAVMTWRTAIAAGLIAPGSGCMLAHDVARNLVNDPLTYVTTQTLGHQFRSEAEAAYDGLCKSGDAASLHHDDYREGFIDGYADLLEHGGPPRPPAVPPYRFRTAKFATLDGHNRIGEYMAGFKAGAELAAGSGRRQFVTLPLAPATTNARPTSAVVVSTPVMAEGPPTVGPPTTAPNAASPGPVVVPAPSVAPPAGEPLPPPRQDLSAADRADPSPLPLPSITVIPTAVPDADSIEIRPPAGHENHAVQQAGFADPGLVEDDPRWGPRRTPTPAPGSHP